MVDFVSSTRAAKARRRGGKKVYFLIVLSAIEFKSNDRDNSFPSSSKPMGESHMFDDVTSTS